MEPIAEKTVIVNIDPLRVTLKQARELTEIIIESFTINDLNQVMWGPEYTFLERPIPAERLPKYNALLTVDSWSTWLTIRGENVRSFSAIKGDKPVGFCMWKPPASEQNLTLPWWHKIQNYFIGAWINVLKFWYFGWGKNPTVMPQQLQDCASAFRQEKTLVHDDPKARRDELIALSDEELAEVCYLQVDYYWCMVLCVSASCQGQGVGGQLFRESIKRLRTRDMLLNGVVKPARLGLIATKFGKPLYDKFGFTTFGIISSVYEGKDIVGTAMQKILD